MNKTSMSGDLTARLQRKMAEERVPHEGVRRLREEFEWLAKSELRQIGAARRHDAYGRSRQLLREKTK